MNVHLTFKSANAKTGPIPVSTSSADTCPTSCAFKKNGCYADFGPLAIHWTKVTAGNRGMAWSEFCSAIAGLPANQLWRHNQAGDLAGAGELIDPVALGELVHANIGRRGFTYTHKTQNTENLKWIKTSNEYGLTINLSANNLDHADKLYDTGAGPVVVVLPVDSPPITYTTKGRKVITCPATYKDNISCATCKLCAIADRDFIVGFPAHDPGKAKIEKITLLRKIS